MNSSKNLIAAANNNVWGEIAYQNGNRTTDSNASGFNSNMYQAVFGRDIYNNNISKAGVGFSLSSTSVSMGSGSATVRQGSLFAFGKKSIMQDYVLDGMVSVGLSSTDVSRNDPTSMVSLEGKGIRGNDVLLSLGISRPYEADNFTISPFIRSTWQMVDQSSFNEGTASAASLSVSGFSGNGLRGLMGISVGAKQKDPMIDKYTYKANIAVGADTNTLINPSMQANLASYGTTIQTANVGSSFVQVGIYGTVKFTNYSFAYAGFSGEARNGQSLGSVNLGAILHF
jgi:outer membrane autotransporter protein